MAQRYLIPQSPLIGSDHPRQEWTKYFAGIEEMSVRTSVNVADLAGGATLADVIAKVNELLAAMQTANQMDS
jgi:hypothetical protein